MKRPVTKIFHTQETIYIWYNALTIQKTNYDAEDWLHI